MSDILNETLKTIIETTRQAGRAENKCGVVPLPNNRFAIVDQFADTVTIKDMDPPARNHELLSINDVASWSVTKIDNEPIIWIGEDKIVVTLDESYSRARGDRAQYTWQHTPEFTLLLELSRANPTTCTFQQAALIRLLRLKLWDCFRFTSERDELIKNLRNVVAQQASNMQQGRGTYEASLTTANTGEAVKWPERISLEVCVYSDPHLAVRMLIDVVFEVDANSKTFTLIPTETSLNNAILATRDQAEEKIRSLVEEYADGINVFLGNP